MQYVNAEAYQLSQYGNNRKLTLPPGSSSKLHNHIEHELWIVKQGQADLFVDGKKNRLSVGDTIYIEPFECHVLRNEHKTEFIMEAHWDLDLASAVKKIRQRDLVRAKTLIQTAFPTPNGNLHIGHLSGAYLCSDIYRRFLELSGGDSYKICGTFGYTNHINKSCDKKQISYNDLVTQCEIQINADMRSFGCEYDSFLSHDFNNILKPIYPKFLKTLQTSGCLYEKEVMHPFSEQENKFIAESYIAGNCAHCNKKTIGMECEACGYFQDEVSMQHIKHAVSGEILTRRRVKRTYFKLNRKTVDAIYEHIYVSRLSSTNRYLNLFDAYLDKGSIQDIPVGSFRGFGVRFGEEQHLSMVFERALRTFYSLNEYPDCTRHYVFCGPDNFYATGILMPCIIKQIGFSLDKTPVAVLNDFCLLENEKFSTSRGHAIWAKDLLHEVEVDFLRAYLISISSECSVSQFQLAEFKLFQERCTHEFRLLKESISKLKTNSGDKNIDPGNWLSTDKAFLSLIDFHNRTCMNCYANFDNKLAWSCVHHMLVLVNEYMQSTLKFTNDYHNYRTRVWLCFHSLGLLIHCLSPIMPTMAAKLRDLIKEDDICRQAE